MSNRYEKLKGVIDLWGEFEAGVNNPTPEAFALWVLQRHLPHPYFAWRPGEDEEGLESEEALRAAYSVYTRSAFAERNGDPEDEVPSASLTRQNLDDALTYLIVRMNRYVRFYFKRVFDNDKNSFETEARNISLDELGFLMVAEQLENPKKSEVIALNLFEPTTGTEILRRLIHMELITQHDNPNDKRSKILNITQKGREVISEAVKHIKHVGTLMGTGLDEQQKRHINLLLTFLNARHGRIFLNQRDFVLKEMLEDNTDD